MWAELNHNLICIYLLCVKRGHFFTSLPVGFCSLGKTLELPRPLNAGLGPEVFILWVLCILEVGYSRFRELLSLTD